MIGSINTRLLCYTGACTKTSKNVAILSEVGKKSFKNFINPIIFVNTFTKKNSINYDSNLKKLLKKNNLNIFNINKNANLSKNKFIFSPLIYKLCSPLVSLISGKGNKNILQNNYEQFNTLKANSFGSFLFQNEKNSKNSNVNKDSKSSDKNDGNNPFLDNKKDPKKLPPQPPQRPDWVNILITLLVTMFLMYSTDFGGAGSAASSMITWQQFRADYLDRGLVQSIEVRNHELAVATLRPDAPLTHVYFSIGSVDAFERQLQEAQDALQVPQGQRVPVSYRRVGSWVNSILGMLPTLLLIGVIFYMFRRAGANAGGGIFGVGKSKAKLFNQDNNVKVSFKDVAGCNEAKIEIEEFVKFLKHPQEYERLGAKIPRGAILYGPPGTGKTLLAKATAGEAGVPFLSVSGSEFIEMFVGVGASRVRDLFSTAKKMAPSIIFIDEIDAIGKARGRSRMGGQDEREATLNQLLVEMDGFDTNEHVVVLAGTNRIDTLDEALLRPGRFDRRISIDPPDVEGRKAIFLVHLKHILTHVNMEMLAGRLAALTPGFTGADIANCVNEAALTAARRKANSVELVHFEAAIDRVIAGLEKKSKVLSPEEKRTIAYHEAGHAICGWYLRWADPLLKVTIIPHGANALGYAQYLPPDLNLNTEEQFIDKMTMTLGGRVSEELHFKSVTSGASNDFQKVTAYATQMVTSFGMSEKVGYVYYKLDNESFQKPFSEKTASLIDSEVHRIVEECHQKCKALLIEKKEQVAAVAEELLKKETINREDLIRILGPRPFPEQNDAFDKYLLDSPLLGNLGENSENAAKKENTNETNESSEKDKKDEDKDLKKE